MSNMCKDFLHTSSTLLLSKTENVSLVKLLYLIQTIPKYIPEPMVPQLTIAALIVHNYTFALFLFFLLLVICAEPSEEEKTFVCVWHSSNLHISLI